jgi:hypothetical protein
MQNGDDMKIFFNSCPIYERFKQPWQPLKGISVKNYVPELCYPNTTKTYKF